MKELYIKYDIANLAFGTIHDKLGDVYEKFCVKILETDKFLEMAKNKEVSEDIEYNIFLRFFSVYGINNFSDIKHIGGSDPIPVRLTHGLSKTDVIAHITYNDGTDLDKFSSRATARKYFSSRISIYNSPLSNCFNILKYARQE